MSLAPNPDFNLWLFGQFQIWQQVISLLRVFNLCSHNYTSLILIFLTLAFVRLINSSSMISVYSPYEIRTFLKSIRLLMTVRRSPGVK